MKRYVPRTALYTEALIVATILLVSFWLIIATWEVFSWSYWGAANALPTNKSEVVRNLGLLTAAIIGLGFGIWRSYTAYRQTEASTQQAAAASDQARTVEQGQITDRYTEAVKMLSDKNARTRVGAVYALARIAQDSIERDHIPVMEVLAEFIRNPPRRKQVNKRADARRKASETKEKDDSDYTAIPPQIDCFDVLAALDVIADRNNAQKEFEVGAHYKINLESAELRELNLHNGKFKGLNLCRANFNGASLTQTDLSDTGLIHADLSGAILIQADLSHAYLIDGNLSSADLSGADLSNAILSNAILIGADLSGAILSGSDGLIQSQIKRSLPSAPPIDLPRDLTWPFVKQDGEWVKRE